jgi:tetratricopeptide (TPR) repeat protein
MKLGNVESRKSRPNFEALPLLLSGLIREVICLPEAPPSVETLVERGVYCHNVGEFDGALSAFESAEELWTAASQGEGLGTLPIEAQVFLGCAIGGVYESMGDDDAALEKYQVGVDLYARIAHSDFVQLFVRIVEI